MKNNHINQSGDLHMIDISEKEITLRTARATGEIVLNDQAFDSIIEFTNKKGDTVTYNHDKVYEVMKSKLSTLPCWEKYKSYTASNNIPMSVRGIGLV